MCIKRIAQATSKLKTRLSQWRENKSTQEQEREADTEAKPLALVQTEVKQTIKQSEITENEFEDDEEGKTYRKQAQSEDTRLETQVPPFASFFVCFAWQGHSCATMWFQCHSAF